MPMILISKAMIQTVSFSLKIHDTQHIQEILDKFDCLIYIINYVVLAI